MLPSLAASVSGWWQRLRDHFGVLAERATGHSDSDSIERPWRHRWDYLPRRSAGAGMTRADYRVARERACEVARATLGDDLWQTLQRQGYLDVPSRRHPGLTYRLRIGRRIEVLCSPGVCSPWPYRWLCINPTYPLPEEEFFAQLYLYARDREDIILDVAAPQPWDQSLGRTF
ncbi:MAG TPA: hypothetical protein VFU63_04435 [Ktedonobacterales bacterium]|nr:hypothetical protein [Ktedonobacterales bacterium]